MTVFLHRAAFGIWRGLDSRQRFRRTQSSNSFTSFHTFESPLRLDNLTAGDRRRGNSNNAGFALLLSGVRLTGRFPANFELIGPALLKGKNSAFMKLTYRNQQTGGEFGIVAEEISFDRAFFLRDRAQKFLTIAWNRGVAQRVIVDEVAYEFPAHTILPLMVNQSFRFERADDVLAWQFNREFYCIVDHDKDVSCVGFLFYGSSQTMFVALDEHATRKIERLFDVFRDEFESADSIQEEMLRMLLVRLIILITRLAKAQQLDQTLIADNRFDLVRQFNLLVEKNYRTKHEVRFYAAQLGKSPKTLANAFALYGSKSPLQLIHERVTLEAKRLMYYTDLSAKEIAYELGFDDAAHFSRFFKTQTTQTPSAFKQSLKNSA